MYRKGCNGRGGIGGLAWQYGPTVGPEPKLHQRPELSDAHQQLMVGFKAETARLAKPMVMCANLGAIGRDSPGGHMELLQYLLTVFG